MGPNRKLADTPEDVAAANAEIVGPEALAHWDEEDEVSAEDVARFLEGTGPSPRPESSDTPPVPLH